MKVILICAGLPTEENPSRGIFNWRAATQLKQYCDIQILFLRAWKPFGPFKKTYVKETITIHEVFLPTLPFFPFLFNLWLAQRTGWLIVNNLINGTDILHSVSAEFCSMNGSYWSKKSGIKHVAQLIGSDINSVIPKLKDKFLIRNWTKYLNGVICNSRALKTNFLTLYPNFSKPVISLYRGTDIQKFIPPLKESRMESITCLFVGGFTPYKHLPYKANTKGGLTIMEVWKQHEQEFKDNHIHLHLAGPDTIGNSEVEKWFSGLRFPEQVKLSAILSQSQIAEAYQKSAVFLLPSKEEGLPNAGVEAAACGCVIAGNNVGGIPEIIEHEQTGLVIQHDNISEWHKAIIELCTNPEKLKAMSAKARRRIEQEFNSANYAVSVIKVYQSV